MEKRNQFIVVSVLLLIVLSTGVFADTLNDIINVFKDIFYGISYIAKWFVYIFFGDLSTPAGQALLMKFILFVALAFGLYELLRAFGVRSGASAVVGTLVALGVTIITPGSALVALFAVYGAFVTLLGLAIILVPYSIFTYKHWSKGSMVNAGLIIGWLALLIMIAAFLGSVGGSGWVISLVAVYILGMIVILISKATSAGRVPSKLGKKFLDWTLGDLITEAAAIETLLEKPVNDLKKAVTNTWDSQTMITNFCDKADPELDRIAAVLTAEWYKPEVSADAKSRINVIVRRITVAGSGPTIGYVGGPRSQSFKEIITTLRTGWGLAAGTPLGIGIAGPTNPATKQNVIDDIVSGFEDLEIVIKDLNKKLKKA